MKISKPWKVGEIRVGKKPEKGFKNPPKIVKTFDIREKEEEDRLNKIPRKGPPKRKKTKR